MTDLELTDYGWNCVTPCGQDGLYNRRSWCHIDNAWDFCQPSHTGQFYSNLQLPMLNEYQILASV